MALLKAVTAAAIRRSFRTACWSSSAAGVTEQHHCSSEGDAAALVDSGCQPCRADRRPARTQPGCGRSLTRLINAHSLLTTLAATPPQARFHCHITVPQGHRAATIAEWDETALMQCRRHGQRAARFTHDATYADGDEFSLEELNWRALAVPGHDMDALAL